jgi:dihydrofolate reductase
VEKTRARTRPRRTEALLLGRKTYEIFAGSWGVWDENAEGLQGELTRRYNRIPKYVASRTLTEVGWKNSQLLGPDVPAAVEKLRAEPGGEIRVWGSTELIRTLAEHDLVDEYRLAVYRDAPDLVDSQNARNPGVSAGMSQRLWNPAGPSSGN